MWVVHQADDPFVLARNQTKAWAWDLWQDQKWGRKEQLAKEHTEGQLAKETSEGARWRRETQKDSRERRAEGTSQDELAVQSG